MGKGDVRMQQQQQQEGEVMEVSRRDAATRLLGAGLLAAAASVEVRSLRRLEDEARK